MKSRSKPVRYTERGFAVYCEFQDAAGQSVRVQESSEIGDPRCWVFTTFADGSSIQRHDPSPDGYTVAEPYLSRKQARKLARALLAFAEPPKRSMRS